MSEALLIVIAAGLGAGGVALLHRAWAAGGTPGSTPLWGAGWSAMLASLLLWARAVSADEGTALGLILLVLAALGLVGLSALKGEIKSRPGRVMREQAEIPHRPGHPLRAALALLVIGPGTGLAALSLSTAAYALFEAAGAEITASLTMVFFLFPLLWGALAFLAALEKRPVYRAGAVFGAALIPAAAVMLTG